MVEIYQNIKDFEETYFTNRENNCFINKLKEKGFSNKSIDDIIGILLNTCTECCDGGIGCQCWNDE